MQVQYSGDDIIVKDIKCLDLDLTLDCGQAFRWVRQEDGSWSGAAKGVFLNIKKEGEDLIFKNTSKEDFEKIWVNYFDLEKDYVQICDRLKQDKLLSSTVDEYYGIRILNQDSWEVLCSFVISQRNTIKRIKGIIARLCEKYGADIGNGFYAFPTAQRLAKLSAEDFEALGAGYRAEYLEKLSRAVAEGEIDLEKIKTLPLEEARTELLKLRGVGIKVANCALLFGFGFYDAFPIDVWMERVMAYYPRGLPACFQGIGGIAQQYLFHWARNHL